MADINIIKLLQTIILEQSFLVIPNLIIKFKNRVIK